MELSLVFTVFFFSLACAADPVVQLAEYEATGFEYSFQHNGAEFVTNAFYRLPYAQPPVGPLRFEKPLPLPANNTKKIVGKVLPPGCYQQEDFAQISSDLDQAYPVSEDCLFLNVVAPSEPAPASKKYQVLVWIHGGGFVYGMSRFYGMQTLARHFNPQGIIVVGIQYRVGFLGFLSLDSSFGNLGLYDQSAALKWINSHISAFGGDPDQVTVWGNSAGSVSTHSQTLSPLSNKYFKNAIQSSGSLYNLWSHSKHTRDIAANFTTTLGCSSTNIAQAKACLRTKTIQQMWQAAVPYTRMNYGMNTVHFCPVADEAFFAGKSIEQLTKESPVKNILYGTTLGEGLVVTLRTESIIASVFAYWLGRTVDQQSSFAEANFTDYLDNYLNTEETSGNKRSQIRKILNKYYHQGASAATNDPKFWYTQYTATQTHGTIQAGIIVEIKDKLKLGYKNLSLYLFDYVHPEHLQFTGMPIKFAPHAYEYQYLTDGEPYFAFDNENGTNAVEDNFTQKLVNGIGAFVKTGSPSTSQLAWPVIKNAEKIDYMEVGQTVAPDNTYFVDVYKNWNKVYELGYGSDIFV
uniref:Carboxylic ester hydrolase n=1 Tax=Ditylenchus dipsaci TaxID=166011 RepID=A0A915DA87_9BILA